MLIHQNSTNSSDDVQGCRQQLRDGLHVVSHFWGVFVQHFQDKTRQDKTEKIESNQIECNHCISSVWNNRWLPRSFLHKGKTRFQTNDI